MVVRGERWERVVRDREFGINMYTLIYLFIYLFIYFSDIFKIDNQQALLYSTWNSAHILVCFSGYLYGFLGKYMFRSSAHFLIELFFSFLSCMGSLHIWILLFIGYTIFKYLLPNGRLSFQVGGFLCF